MRCLTSGACAQVVWWVIPLFWLPIITAGTWWCASGKAVSSVALLFGLGILYWTLVEYTLHRFIFHMDHHLPEHPVALSAHFLLHGVHHKAPNDRYRLVFPPLPAVVLCFIVGYLSRLLTRALIPDLYDFGVFYMGMVCMCLLVSLQVCMHACDHTDVRVCVRAHTAAAVFPSGAWLRLL